MSTFSHENQPQLNNIQDKVAKGMWNLEKQFIKYNDELYELEGIEYEIPFNQTNLNFEIESEGKPKIFIKSDDGVINKLITDKQLQELSFEDGDIINVKK